MSSGSIIRRAVLDRCDHALLARLLRPHAAFFTAAGVDLNALAQSEQDDRTLPRRIYSVVNDASATATSLPAALVDVLSSLDTLANVRGELKRLDTEGVLPHATHGPENLALTALLSAPEIAARARQVAVRDASHKFMEYAPRSPLPPVTFDEPTIAKIRAHLGKALEAIDHSRYCEIGVDVRAAYVDFEFEHGTRPRTREVINTESLQTTQTTDVTAQRSYVRFHRSSGRLALHATGDTLKNLLRQSLGEALFGDADLFHVAGLYDLAPFSDLERALSNEAVLNLTRVELRLLRITGERHWQEFGSGSDDIRKVIPEESISAALARGRVAAVKLFLFMDGVKKKRVKVELSANGRNNSIDYPRTDADVVEVIEDYLRARRILSEPDDGSASSEAAE